MIWRFKDIGTYGGDRFRYSHRDKNFVLRQVSHYGCQFRTSPSLTRIGETILMTRSSWIDLTEN